MMMNFDIQRVSLGGPIFDVEKLSWLNGLWIRENHTDEELADRLVEWALNRKNLLAVLPHARQRMETLSDFVPLAGFLASGTLPLTEADFEDLKSDQQDVVRALQFVLWQLEVRQEWQRDGIFADVKAVADALEVKMKDFLAPFFIAVSGSAASFSVFDAMLLLGPDMTRARLRHAIEVLGGVSKKGLKKLEKEYASLQQE